MAKPNRLTALVLGITLIVVGAAIFLTWASPGDLIPAIIGGVLCCLGLKGGRAAVIVFGHACIVAGCFLITWGIYLLPYSQPTLSHIFGRPLFWGLFSLMGGVCAIYHGFCSCIRG